MKADRPQRTRRQRLKRSLAWQDFYSLQRFGMTPDLENIRLFCERLGHPEAAFPSIHIGGTNGKGSVTAMLGSILRCAGLKVGMYTSPHILRYEERIRVGGQVIPEKDVFAFLDEHWDFISAHQCTFFEVATAMALDYFRIQGIDVAVVEVGLGGTFDATRVVHSILALMSRIDLDHTERLGNTLMQIAADKAGIFHNGFPAVSGDQRPEVLAVLKAKADQVGAKLVSARDLVSFSSCSITRQGLSGTATLSAPHLVLLLRDWKCPLTGAFQFENVRLALAAAVMLSGRYPQIDVQAMGQGLASVSWPGRLQQLRENPALIVDVGHNPGAVASALVSIRDIWQPRRIIAIFSALQDKDIPAMVGHLKAAGAEGFVVPLPPPRGLTLAQISEKVAQFGWNATPLTSVSKALQAAFRIAEQRDLILVIGSHYLAEEVLKNHNFP